MTMPGDERAAGGISKELAAHRMREKVALIIRTHKHAGLDSRSAADEIIAAILSSGWRDIASAPRDGTLILGWNGRWLGLWHWSRPNMVPSIMPAAWLSASHVNHIDQPTHWMPLPEPPPPPTPNQRSQQ